MHFPSTLLATAFLLPTLAFAQETTATSALTITTNDRSVASGVLEMFQSSADLPEMGDGQVAVLSLDDGGKIIVRGAAGDAWMRIDAHPAQLMEIFGAQVAQGQQMAQMMGGMALGQAGFDFDDVDQMVAALFAFPKQIEALAIVIPTEYVPGEAMSVDVDIHPKADTWFGSLVSSMQPLAGGIPHVEASDRSMVQMDASVDMAKVLPHVMPMLGMFAGVGQPDKDAKASAAKLMRTYYESVSGAVSMSFDMQSGAKVLMGVADPAKLKTLLADPAYADMAKNASEASGMVEATVETTAMTHRDIPVMRTTIEYDDPDMAPFAEDGKLQTYLAVAGDVMIMTMLGGAKPEVQATIDAALDQKIEKIKLGPGQMLKAGVNVASLLSFMEQQGAMVNANDAPETIGMSVAKSDKGLKLRVDVK